MTETSATHEPEWLMPVRMTAAAILAAAYYALTHDLFIAACLVPIGFVCAIELTGAAIIAVGFGALLQRWVAPAIACELIGILWIAQGLECHKHRDLFAGRALPWPRTIRAFSGMLAGLFIVAAMVRGVPVLPMLAVACAYAVLAFRASAALPRKPITAKRTVVGMVILAISVLIALSILELGARLLIRTPLLSPHRSVLWEHHPRTYWAPKPNVHADGIDRKSPTEWNVFHVDIAPQGMRGPEVGPKQPGELRVLLAGDSFTFGWGMPEGRDPAAQLRAKLAEKANGRPVSVLNTGTIGFGPWQEQILLEERGLPLDPDVVILQLYPPNDLGNTLAKFNRVLPAYYPRIEEFFAYWRDYNHWVVRTETWLRVHSQAYQAYRIIWRDSSVGLPEALSHLKFVTPYPGLNLPPPANRPPIIEATLAQWYPELEFAWEEFTKDVLAIVEVCRARDIPIILYAVPFRLISEQGWNDYMREVDAQTGGSVHYEQFRDVRKTEAFFAENGLHWIPLLDALLAHSDPDALFLPWDGHFNEAGGALMTDLIIERLEKDGFLTNP